MPELHVTCTGHDLDAKDTGLMGGKSDPYLIVFQSGKEVARSTVVPNTLNPSWPPFIVNCSELKSDAEYKVECWDKDKIGSDDLIGTASLTLDDLMDDETELQLISRKQTPSGRIKIVSSSIEGVVAPESNNFGRDKTPKKKIAKEDRQPTLRKDEQKNPLCLRMYAVNSTDKPLKISFTWSKCSGMEITRPFVVVEPGKEELCAQSIQGKGYGYSLSYSWKNYAPPVDDLKEDPGMFCDPVFAPNPQSLGDAKATLADRWFLARDLGERGSGVLFDGIDPYDVRQGALGDCWLIASISCLAATPSKIQKLFSPQGLSPDGRYTVRLFDVCSDSWVDVEIDERVPCKVRDDFISPVFADPMGEEIWVPLLEKAFAKFYGSYSFLNGGQEFTALQAMTGAKECSFYDKRTGEWKKLSVLTDVQIAGGKSPRPKGAYLQYVKVDVSASDSLWNAIKGHVDAGDAMSASISKKDKSVQGEGQGDLGLVTGHAYSFLEACDVKLGKRAGRVKLVRLRNPWGNDKEWEGDWSDDSPKWQQYPKLLVTLKQTSEDDGTFWMSWDDFFFHFTQVWVCHCGVKGREVVFEEPGPVADFELEDRY